MPRAKPAPAKAAAKPAPAKAAAKQAPTKARPKAAAPVEVGASARAPRGDAFRVASWNVNGLRSVLTKGFTDWLTLCDADVVGLQETRLPGGEVPASLRVVGGYEGTFRDAERPGYSGVALYARRPADEVVPAFGVPVLDAEGRLVAARFGDVLVVNGYFPNGSGKDRDNSRVPYKLDFYRALHAWLEPYRARGAHVVVMGDFNTAHEPIDLARPKQNEATSGFLPAEREELARWLRTGWADAFRRLEPGPDHYTWWSQRFGVREKNIGWRIDYTLVPEGTMRHVRAARVHPDVRGSDHCPITLDLDPALASAR